MSHKHLYSEQDNINLSSKMEEVKSKFMSEDTNTIENTTEVLQENVNTTKSNNNSEINNDELYNSIKDIFEKNLVVKRNNIYFTISKGKKVFNIDDTIFAPIPIVLVSGKRFEETYMRQLENFIYTNKETIDTDKLFMLIYLFEYINKKQYPITITSSKYNKLRSKIVKTLNTYFNKNYSIISSMSTMFSSFSTSSNSNENV